jgi:putative OmpL-like beta-barrel porin-2
MKFNKWTLGLAAVGVVSLTSVAYADETKVSQVQTALSNTTLSGYVDVSAQFNPGGGGGAAPNYTFGNKANGINLNVVDIALDKPQDESPWASGYHAELWIGPDAAALGTTTFNPNSSSAAPTASTSDVGIRQAYIVLRTPIGNGIDWKIGVWDTIIGYESTTSGNNPNYSHSLGYNIEPTTHTGILAAYKATDWLSMQAGVADTSYAGGGAYTSGLNNGLYLPTFMWGPTLTAPDSFGWAKGATLSFGTINTSGSTASEAHTGPSGGATSYYAGLTLPTPIAALKFGAAFDYLNARDINGNEWVAGVYSTYQFNDKLGVNLRAEYNDILGSTPNGDEITATVQYAMWANVLTRLEFRWDHDEGGTPFISHGSTPTVQNNAFLLAAQAIYTF